MKMIKRTGYLLIHAPQKEIVLGNKTRNSQSWRMSNSSSVSVPASSVKYIVSFDYKIEIMF